jgi:hypothetical protein
VRRIPTGSPGEREIHDNQGLMPIQSNPKMKPTLLDLGTTGRQPANKSLQQRLSVFIEDEAQGIRVSRKCHGATFGMVHFRAPLSRRVKSSLAVWALS